MYNIYSNENIKRIKPSIVVDDHSKAKSMTKYFWWTNNNIHNDIDIFDYSVPEYDEGLTHYFINNDGFVGSILYPKRNSKGSKIVQRNFEIKGEMLDIAFISNGEPNAEKNYELLLSKNLPNRVYRVDGVNGRGEAYKEAARRSNTKNFYAVFAKIELNDFDFRYTVSDTDDRHYVFKITNPINGLEYGHQALIIYNKKLVLENECKYLDFTMAQPFSPININTGVARYNVSPLITWRSAFRECLKLKLFNDDVSNERLAKWLTGDENEPFFEYSIDGARKAIEFFDEVNGSVEELHKASYEWDSVNHLYESFYGMVNN